MIKRYGIAEALDNLGANIDYDPIKQFFLDPDVTDEYSLAWTSAKEQELFSFLCDEHDFSRDRVENTLERMANAQKGADQRSLSQWL
jgi:flap endonuclease-1